MLELLARHRPDAVAVEGVFYGKNVRTTVVLGHARGVILLAAERGRRARSREYSPALVKKTVVGRGAALKPQVGVHGRAAAPAPAPPEPADAADGVAVALTHLLVAARRGASRAPAHSMIAAVSGILARASDAIAIIETDGRRRLRDHGAARRRSSGCPAPGAPCSCTRSWWSGRTAGRCSGSTRPASGWCSSDCSGASGFGPQAGARDAVGAGPRAHGAEHPGQATSRRSPRVSGVGKKKAERLVLELRDRFGDARARRPPGGAAARRRGGGAAP